VTVSSCKVHAVLSGSDSIWGTERHAMRGGGGCMKVQLDVFL